MTHVSRSGRRGTAAALLLAAGFLAGGWWNEGLPARAEIRSTAPPVHMQSGGARSEVLLQQMAGTLERIDGRLQRLEGFAAECARRGTPAERRGTAR